jgi:ribosomal protein S18 acetylase RimI-like enzyme
MRIRHFEEKDWDPVWHILKPVFRAGETYAFSPDIDKKEARRIWTDVPAATYVAVSDEGDISGTYYIKPNQSGPGSHVCNCGYIVSDQARGKGVASQMCEHSESVAREMGFRAMQFNLVVSTNQGAVRLWKSLGFDIVGTLPGSFLHPVEGYVDAYVMYKAFVE